MNCSKYENTYYGVLESAEIIKESDGKEKKIYIIDMILKEKEEKEYLSIENLAEMDSFLLTIKSSQPTFNLARSAGDRDPIWYEIEIGSSDPHGVELEADISKNFGNNEHIGNREINIRRVNNKKKNNQLKLKYTLENNIFKKFISDEKQIKEIIRKNSLLSHNQILKINNVGQGSSATLFSPYLSGVNYIKETCYFDVGGDIYKRNGEKKNLNNALPCEGAVVILSHWDMDHWVSAFNNEKLQNLHWVTPIQSVGVSHAIMASRIACKGKLHLWPRNEDFEIHEKHICIYKLNDSSDRNNSGLCAVINIGKNKKILVPGDASYGFLPKSLLMNNKFYAVLVPHHGGKTKREKTLPLFNNGGYAFCSYGNGNIYGHPKKEVKKAHEDVGAQWISIESEHEAITDKNAKICGEDIDLSTDKSHISGLYKLYFNIQKENTKYI